MTTRISRIYFGDFQQFKELELDFRDLDGNASNRICFIGRNGTGKSTLLDLLSRVLRGRWSKRMGKDVVGLLQLDNRFEAVRRNDGRRIVTWGVPDTVRLPDVSPTAHSEYADPADLHVWWPAEFDRNQSKHLEFAPETTLADALQKAQRPPASRHYISPDSAKEVWDVLIQRIHKRREQREAFERREENLEKTKRQLIEEFDRAHPDVLEGLVHLWNRLLSPARLKVDRASVNVPTSMQDNLDMRIKLSSTGEHLPYGALSTGIRNFLFQVGHLWLLYFDRDIQNGFVFIDEPENSLFPDFLFELMTLLDEILGENTQLFVATHSPLVAAQFEPWQRILLDWNDDGTVSARKGTAPKGDDPNDVLTQDFELTEVMGPAGRAAYRKYLSLRKQLRRANEPEKTALLEEAAEIGRAYGFE